MSEFITSSRVEEQIKRYGIIILRNNRAIRNSDNPVALRSKLKGDNKLLIEKVKQIKYQHGIL